MEIKVLCLPRDAFLLMKAIIMSMKTAMHAATTKSYLDDSSSMSVTGAVNIFTVKSVMSNVYGQFN